MRCYLLIAWLTQNWFQGVPRSVCLVSSGRELSKAGSRLNAVEGGFQRSEVRVDA
jgi:hypothetical protein